MLIRSIFTSGLLNPNCLRKAYKDLRCIFSSNHSKEEDDSCSLF